MIWWRLHVVRFLLNMHHMLPSHAEQVDSTYLPPSSVSKHHYQLLVDRNWRVLLSIAALISTLSTRTHWSFHDGNTSWALLPEPKWTLIFVGVEQDKYDFFFLKEEGAWLWRKRKLRIWYPWAVCATLFAVRMWFQTSTQNQCLLRSVLITTTRILYESV